jgi:vacuolar-type H+-ATPase subunit F/Vma7
VRESAEANVVRAEFVEIDQDDKALAVNGYQSGLDYSVIVIN